MSLACQLSGRRSAVILEGDEPDASPEFSGALESSDDLWIDSRPRDHLLHFVCCHGKPHAALAISPGRPARFALAVAGFKRNLWLVVTALAGHGVFDFSHQMFIQNPGVPGWWPRLLPVF